MKKYLNSAKRSIKVAFFSLLAMLAIPSQSEAWIAYGFVSGMSRFEVYRRLSENESLFIADDDRQTHAGPKDNKTQYNFIYCSTPQRLYLMRYSLDDSRAQFLKTKEKFERRYGEPTPLYSNSDYSDSTAWDNAQIFFMWDLGESETILLTHDSDGTRVEFQDLSVCERELTG